MSAPLKSCFVCGREDARGFSRLEADELRDGEWSKGHVWVCRPPYGCEGVGPLHLAFFGHEPAREEAENGS